MTSLFLSGAQSQLVCSGCRNLLLYPVGATSVCCAVCKAVTTVPPPGMFTPQVMQCQSKFQPYKRALCFWTRKMKPALKNRKYTHENLILKLLNRNRNGPVGMRRLPHLAYVHPWSHKCSMLLLSHCQSGNGRYL